MAAFNEDAYLPHPRRAKDCAERVNRGYAVMAKQRVVIAGLARNNATILPLSMARIEHTGRMFADYRVLIYENDSADNTREQLLSWAETNSRVTAICEDRSDPINPGTRCLKRTERMAVYRNKCLDYIGEHFSGFDKVILVDVDVVGGWSYDGLANTFGQPVLWHAVGSNGIIYKDYGRIKNRALYYDVWAFRWRGDWEAIHPGNLNPRQWARGEPLMLLNSCFGGLGVYDTSAFLSSRYDGTDCEHVPFHRGMVAAGYDRLFMNPSQIVVY